MSQPLSVVLLAIVSLSVLPVVVLAQLPTPTYGWNMGNTMEPPSGEGSWGGKASEALINAVADAGYNAVRVPCAWESNSTNGQINPEYMARVTQIVDWCLARDLHVIINCHWDGGWFDSSGFRSVDPVINEKVKSYWTQIAKNFVDHDSRLIFAAANEPDVDSEEKTKVLIQYYETFINAVRATGGQNTDRWLILSGPSTSSEKTYDWFTLPSDPTPGRLMVDVHEYTPSQFTLLRADASWGRVFYFWGKGYHHPMRLDRNPTWGEEDYIEKEHRKMKTKFVDKGVPVIVGEYHANLKTGIEDLTGWDYELHLASRTYWHKTVLETAHRNGLKPFYWDTPGGFFDWETGEVLNPDNIRATTGGPALPPPPPPAP